MPARLLTLAIALLALVLPACGNNNGDKGAQERTQTSKRVASRLEGTWKTGPIGPQDVEATLRRHGLAKWIKRFRPISPIPEPTILTLDLKDGGWNLYGKPATGPRQKIDFNAKYVVRRDEVEKIHATGATTYRWSVNGSSLKFQWLRTTEPPSKGIPDEVYSRALYMTRPFKRQR
jgi:hypothetical protein